MNTEDFEDQADKAAEEFWRDIKNGVPIESDPATSFYIGAMWAKARLEEGGFEEPNP